MHAITRDGQSGRYYRVPHIAATERGELVRRALVLHNDDALIGYFMRRLKRFIGTSLPPTLTRVSQENLVIQR